MSRFVAALLAFSLTGPALAQREPMRERISYNVVDLQASAEVQVANDLLQAVLYVEANDADPSRLAAALNRALNDGLRTAKAVAAVTARSGGYQTHPVYDRSQRLTGWRGRAEMRLESRDFEAASALIGKLQSSLQLGSIAFSVSPEARRQAQDRLIAEAIGAFKARADIVRGAMAGKGYKVRRMNINAEGAFPPPRPAFAPRALASAEQAPPPPLEGGTSRIAVSATGTIEVE